MSMHEEVAFEENDYPVVFTGDCTCEHDREEHGWGSCEVESCKCEAGWEE